MTIESLNKNNGIEPKAKNSLENGWSSYFPSDNRVKQQKMRRMKPDNFPLHKTFM